MMKILVVSILAVIVGATASAETQFIKYKNYLIPIVQEEEICMAPKLLISTDYGDWEEDRGPLGSPGGDAGEAASMTHVLSYANWFDIRGIISSITIGTGEKAEIEDHIDYYLEDVNDFGWDLFEYPYPTSIVVKEGIRLNSNNLLPEYWESASMNNDAVQLIVDEAKLASPSCPLNIVVWGGILEVASALYVLDQSDPAAKANVRVIANGGANRIESMIHDEGTQQRAWNALADDDGINDLANFGTVILYEHLGTNLVPRKEDSSGCQYPLDHDQVLYDNETGEDVMDSITDQSSDRNSIPISSSNFPVTIQRGMRSRLQQARYHINKSHCSSSAPIAINSMKSGDSLTFMYVLDDFWEVYGGRIVDYVKPESEVSHGRPNNDYSGVAPDNETLRTVYQDYRDLNNQLY